MIKEEYKYSELTSKIIGCAMKVQSTLGNGFQEVIYQRALAIEFRKNNIFYERERVGAVAPTYTNGTILEFHLNVPTNLQQQKLGTFIMKQSIIDYNPHIVKGWWKKIDIYSGGESINLTIFKQKLLEGFSPQAAALETPTGKILKDSGFGGTPTVILNSAEEVIIHFNKN
jgi:hypothetical protein